MKGELSVTASKNVKSTAVFVRNVNLCINGNQILSDISFELEKGRILGLIGHNGSGKTMLMKCLCGFVRPSSGEIVVNGEKLGVDVDFPSDIGLIIESPGFIPYHSGFENLRLLALLRKKISEDDIRRTMREVGLDPDLKLPVRKYSLGMRQRLGIAQAVMESPSLLVLDEPMNGLDRQGVTDMRHYLMDLRQQGKTIIIASHSSEDIRLLCDEIYEMEHGIMRMVMDIT